MDAPQIDWTGAEVHDGALRVPLSGDPSKEWRSRLEGVLALLSRTSRGDWGEIEVSKKRIDVDRVASGTEADLRHLLESAVQEANADSERESEAAEDGHGEPSADERMTAA